MQILPSLSVCSQLMHAALSDPNASGCSPAESRYILSLGSFCLVLFDPYGRPILSEEGPDAAQRSARPSAASNLIVIGASPSASSRVWIVSLRPPWSGENCLCTSVFALLVVRLPCLCPDTLPFLSPCFI